MLQMFNWFIGFAVNWRKILCIGSLDYGNLMYDSKWWNVSWYPCYCIFYHCSLGLIMYYKHCCDLFVSCCVGREKWRELNGFHGIIWLFPSGHVLLHYYIWKCIWWLIDLHYYDICVNNINHGDLWWNILLSMKFYDWCMGKLRFKHRGGRCSMDVFV